MKDEDNVWYIPLGIRADEASKTTKAGDSGSRTSEPEADERQGVSYLKSSVRQLFLGNYTDDVTVLGTAAQVGTGFLGVDLPN